MDTIDKANEKTGQDGTASKQPIASGAAESLTANGTAQADQGAMEKEAEEGATTVTEKVSAMASAAVGATKKAVASLLSASEKATGIDLNNDGKIG
jgi:hypothetical protein